MKMVKAASASNTQPQSTILMSATIEYANLVEHETPFKR